jgi:hypothetical protein
MGLGGRKCPGVGVGVGDGGRRQGGWVTIAAATSKSKSVPDLLNLPNNPGAGTVRSLLFYR